LVGDAPGASATLQHLQYTKSYHRPILLDIEYQTKALQQHTGPRRFEAKWLQEKGFHQMVQQARKPTAATSSGGVLSKLSHMHEALHAWDKAILKKSKCRLGRAQRRLEKAMNGLLTEENENLAKEMSSMVELLLEQ
jgi:hypothetical protein